MCVNAQNSKAYKCISTLTTLRGIKAVLIVSSAYMILRHRNENPIMG